MIREKTTQQMPIIDLTGPEGNAFVLMGYAKKWAKDLGLDSDLIIAEMMQGDYENLVDVFDCCFGDFVILER
jgi:hypothetical protein